MTPLVEGKGAGKHFVSAVSSAGSGGLLCHTQRHGKKSRFASGYKEDGCSKIVTRSQVTEVFSAAPSPPEVSCIV